jgi:hypothetical protein
VTPERTSLLGPQYRRGRKTDRRQRGLQFAALVQKQLLTLVDTGDLDALFDDAVHIFSGRRLQDLRDELEPRDPGDPKGYDDKSFRDMIITLRGNELAGLGENDHRPPRTLLLIAGEHRIVPFLEGALHAIEGAPHSARLDLRSAFHVITRWGADREPKLARLVAAALAKDCEAQPWGPLTRMYARVLGPYEPHVPDREVASQELSRRTTVVLYNEYRARAPKGRIMRRLLNEAEELGILDERPHVAVAPASRTRAELSLLLLKEDVGIPHDPATASLIALLAEGAS